MTLTELSERVGVPLAGLPILENGRGRAMRFAALTARRGALDRRPGGLLHRRPSPGAGPRRRVRRRR